MKKLLKKWGMVVGIVLVLALLFGVTRVVNLTKLPIFTDEAIYIRWAQIGLYDASWRFISLTDGKQPLFPWLMMMTLRLIKDPLFAGRFASVIAGTLGVIGIGFLSFEVFGLVPLALLTSFFYIICPFTTWYDRMALYDSLVAALSIWNLYLAIRLVKKPRLDLALIYGMALGLGMLNKTSGFLSFYMVPATLLLFDWKKKDLWKRLFHWGMLVVVALGISQAMYGILRLSPYFHMIAQKDTVFVYSFRDFPLLYQFFPGKLSGLFDWLTHYLSLPVFLLSLGSLLFTVKYREKALLLVWWLAPFVALAYFGKVLYPRFVLFMSMPLMVLAMYSLYFLVKRLKLRIYTVVLVLLILLPSIRTTFYIVTNPTYAPIPDADRGQMIDDWPAGYGVKEVNAYLARDLSEGKKVAVFTEGTFGLFPYAIEMYFWNNPNIVIKGIWPIPKDIPLEMHRMALERSTYLVLNLSQAPPPSWPVLPIAEYNKGTNPVIKMRLYKVLSQPLAVVTRSL